MAIVFSISVPLCAHAEQATGVYNLTTHNTQTQNSISTFDILNAIDPPVNQSQSDFSVEVDNISDNSAVLTWQSDTVYISYTICQYNVFNGEYDEYLVTTNNSANLTNLLADTNYKFSITATATGKFLGAVSFVTSTQKTSIKIGEVTSKQISLYFENVKDRAKIALYRSTNDSDFEKIAVIEGEKTYVDTDVEQGTTYSYRAKAIVKTQGKINESEYSTVKQATTLVSMGLPKVSGKCKTYAYYTACNIKSTPQYKLLNSADCYTDEETGIRMVDGYYCVALGSYYGSTIGTKYRVTFSTGNSINVILCDQKANRHTDKNNQYAVAHRDIMEFYVEKGKVPSSVRGNYNALEKFKGSIVSIEKYVD